MSAHGLVLALLRGMSTSVTRPSNRLERLAGRSLALCVHPYAAWRTRSNRDRVLVFFAYAAGSYAVVLTVLQLPSRRSRHRARPTPPGSRESQTEVASRDRPPCRIVRFR